MFIHKKISKVRKKIYYLEIFLSKPTEKRNSITLYHQTCLATIHHNLVCCFGSQGYEEAINAAFVIIILKINKIKNNKYQ